MKKLSEIRFGQRVWDLLEEETTFHDVCSQTGLDKHSTQKVLATLAKCGYIENTGRFGLWVRVDNGQKSTR